MKYRALCDIPIFNSNKEQIGMIEEGRIVNGCVREVYGMLYLQLSENDLFNGTAICCKLDKFTLVSKKSQS